MERSSWFGHQSWLVRGRVRLGVGEGIAGFSLSLVLAELALVSVRSVSDTSVLLLSGCERGAGVVPVRWVRIDPSLCLRLGPAQARRTAAPEDDFGLVDLVARVVRGGEAGGFADGAGDVGHGVAL